MKNLFSLIAILCIAGMLAAVEPPTKYPSQHIDNWEYDETSQSQKVLVSSTAGTGLATLITSTLAATINQSADNIETYTGISSTLAATQNNTTTDIYTILNSTYITDAFLRGGFEQGFIQGDLTASATVYFYGYATSWLVGANLSTCAYKANFNFDMPKKLRNAEMIGDNFIGVMKSSPCYIYIDVPSGGEAEYYLGGFYKRN